MADQSWPTYFLDSSAIAKRYAEETGTAWIQSLCAPTAGIVIALAQIGVVEVAAVLAAKHRGGLLTNVAYEEEIENLLSDAEKQYSLIAVDKTVIDHAVQLTRRRKLRGYDAVQLACALVLNQALTSNGMPTPVFVSADSDLLAAARAEGLAIENPNLHTTPQP